MKNDEYTGDLTREQRAQMADCLGVAIFDRHRASCERLERALGALHSVSVTTQFFSPPYEDDEAPWYCDLRFEARRDQPFATSRSGLGPTRTRAVWSAAWAAFQSGELGEASSWARI